MTVISRRHLTILEKYEQPTPAGIYSLVQVYLNDHLILNNDPAFPDPSGQPLSTFVDNAKLQSEFNIPSDVWDEADPVRLISQIADAARWIRVAVWEPSLQNETAEMSIDDFKARTADPSDLIDELRHAVAEVEDEEPEVKVVPTFSLQVHSRNARNTPMGERVVYTVFLNGELLLNTDPAYPIHGGEYPAEPDDIDDNLEEGEPYPGMVIHFEYMEAFFGIPRQLWHQVDETITFSQIAYAADFIDRYLWWPAASKPVRLPLGAITRALEINNGDLENVLEYFTKAEDLLEKELRELPLHQAVKASQPLYQRMRGMHVKHTPVRKPVVKHQRKRRRRYH